MEKFKIELSLHFSGRDLHLLNRDFYSMDILEKPLHGRHSSYHQKEEFKANWVRYPSLPQGNFLICSSSEEYSFEEAISFMAHKNGIGLTRDNLFAGANLRLDDIVKKIPQEGVKIFAFMSEEFLPAHLNYPGRKICPLLEINKKTLEIPLSTSNIRGDYDWFWTDEKFTPSYMFAFFAPSFV